MPQIQIDPQPVTKITIIGTDPERQAEPLSLMAERARFMRHQPGLISISLHRCLDGRRIVNYISGKAAVSCDLLRAYQWREFRKAWNQFERLTTTSVLTCTRSPRSSPVKQ